MSPLKGQPPVLGLLGGIASGKTTIARQLVELGARVVSADDVAHDVLERPQTREWVVARWGPDTLGDDGKIDREKLGHRVFEDTQELAALEAITHPDIVTTLRRQIEEARRSQDVMAVVVDAPLLLEAELDGLCDHLVFVECPLEVRRARAVARGWDPDELDRREAHQRPVELKRQCADVIIEGDKPLETTLQQVQQLWQETLGL